MKMIDTILIEREWFRIKDKIRFMLAWRCLEGGI